LTEPPRITEQELMKRIQAALSGAGCRAFRTNVGQGWTGSKVIRHQDGSVTILDARPFSTGLPKGFPDLLVVADGGLVTFLEIKTPTGRLTEEQIHFAEQLTAWGANVKTARSEEEAIRVCNPPE
jgi:hypothetical protein